MLPKLIDFGVSRFVGGPLAETAGRRLRSVLPTTQDRIIGTPEYMSPEQAQALPDVDQRSDLYAAGVMLYEMLAGELPFEAQTRAILLIRVVTEDPPPLEERRPDLAGPVSEFLQQALAKAPAERFPDARSMRLALIRATERWLRMTERPDADSIARAIEAAYEPGDSTLIRIRSALPRDPRTTAGTKAGARAAASELGMEDGGDDTQDQEPAMVGGAVRAGADEAAFADEETAWESADSDDADAGGSVQPRRARLARDTDEV